MFAVFEGHGIKLDKPILATSYTGFSNCIVALAAHICGKEDTAIYYVSITSCIVSLAEYIFDKLGTVIYYELVLWYFTWT